MRIKKAEIIQKINYIAKYLQQDNADLIWDHRNSVYGKYLHRLIWKNKTSGGESYFQGKERYMTFSEFNAFLDGIERTIDYFIFYCKVDSYNEWLEK